MFKKLFKSLSNYEGVVKVKTVVNPVCWIVLICTVFFTYVSLIPIDEATEEMYLILDSLASLFYVLGSIALAILIFLTVLTIIQKKKYYKNFNKKKTKVYLFDVINFLWMGVFCLCCIYPIYYVLIGSFNQGADYNKGGVYLLPRVFTFENYKIVLKETKMWHSYLVTFGRTIIGTVTSVVYTSIVAYAMSRNNLKFKKAFYYINIFTMFFGGGLVPYFLIIKSLNLYDSFWVYIIPGLYSVYNMIVMSSFFKSISNELHEAAVVDGAGEFRIWWQIYLPLSKPVLATVALWAAVGHWNSYFDTMIYTASEKLQTLQYFLLKAISTSNMTEGMPSDMLDRISPRTISLAAIIISIIPVLFFFPFVRKNFQSGIMIGSLKG